MTSHLRKIKNQFNTDYCALKSKLRYSYFEAFLSSFVVGIAESFFAAFAIEKGMSVIQSGLLLSLPLIIAVGLNLLLNFYLQKRSISKQVQKNVLLQIFSLIGLIAFSFAPQTHSIFIFCSLLSLYSIYWYGFFSSQPAWNTWISELLSADDGHAYFALRTRLTQVGIISGLVLGGAILHWKVVSLPTAHLFALLFATASVAKYLKYYSFQKHEPSQSVMNFSFAKIKNILKQNTYFFKTYALFNASLFLSSTYVAGYLLTVRNIDYLNFMIIIASLYMGKIALTYILSLQKSSTDPIKMMAFGGICAAPLPLFWPYCERMEAFYILHFISGMAWAQWEIGLSLMFFKKINGRDKIETVTLYNSIGIVTQVIGTCLGAFSIKFLFNYNYTALFVFAGIIRFLCILPFQKNKNLGVTDSNQVLKAS